MSFWKSLDEIVTGAAFAVTHPAETMGLLKEEIRKDFYSQLNRNTGGSEAMSFQHTMRQVCRSLGAEILALDSESCTFTVQRRGHNYMMGFLRKGYLMARSRYNYKVISPELRSFVENMKGNRRFSFDIAKGNYITVGCLYSMDPGLPEAILTVADLAIQMDDTLDEIGL